MVVDLRGPEDVFVLAMFNQGNLLSGFCFLEMKEKVTT